MCLAVCVDMSADMCAETRTHMYAQMMKRSSSMCGRLRIDVRVDMCQDLYVDVSRHVSSAQ